MFFVSVFTVMNVTLYRDTGLVLWKSKSMRSRDANSEHTTEDDRKAYNPFNFLTFHLFTEREEQLCNNVE